MAMTFDEKMNNAKGQAFKHWEPGARPVTQNEMNVLIDYAKSLEEKIFELENRLNESTEKMRTIERKNIVFGKSES